MSPYATDGVQQTGMPGGEPEPEDTAETAVADAPAPGQVTPPDAAPGDEWLPDGEEPVSEEPDGEEPVSEDPVGEEPVSEDTVSEDTADGDLSSGDVPAGRRKLSKLAVFALVTGILPAVPLALVSGTAALAAIRRTGRRGRGMAVTALFLAAAWVIVGGAVGTVAVLTHGFKKPVKTIYHEAAVFSLRPGECIDIPNGSSPTVVSCTVPHDAEVFGTFALPGSAWPGTAAVQREAGTGCGTRLTSYLNPQLAISLTQTYVYPGQVDWNAGTRTVVCEVRAVSGQLTQSVRGG